MNGGAEPIVVELLRTPSPEDRDAVLALEAASFSNPWTPETFDTMFTVPVSRVFVARSQDGGIIGFCACWLIGDELHINTIAVRGDLRRRGIGTRLLGEVLTRTGVRRATLEVRRSNVAAIALYERFGFKVTAVRHQYYDKPAEDGLIFWLDPSL